MEVSLGMMGEWRRNDEIRMRNDEWGWFEGKAYDLGAFGGRGEESVGFAALGGPESAASCTVAGVRQMRGLL